MKMLLLTTTLVFALVGSASATMPNVIPNEVEIGLDIFIKDGVATIHGRAESSTERKMAVQHAAMLDGVKKVIDLSTLN